MKHVIFGFLAMALIAGCSTATPIERSTASTDVGLERSVQPDPRSSRDDDDLGFVTVYFDYDEASLRADAKAALQRNAEYLREKPSVRVELQGNCDERGTEEYNLALGRRRAEAAKQYLADLGLSTGRMTTVSFGEENPAVPGSGESAWAKNRRVDFVIR